VVLARGEAVHEVRVARLADGAFGIRAGAAEMRAEWRGGRWWIDGQARRRAGRSGWGGGCRSSARRRSIFTLPDPLAVEAAAGAAAGVVRRRCRGW
jgi:3-methylcrotonyl-CoA carboxylase alpha subunit